jgi:sporulation protein YpjB
MKIIRLYIIPLLMIFFLFPSSMLAEESPISELDNIADQALQMTKVGRLEEAKQLLQHFSDEFSVASVHHSFSMDELRVLTVAHNQAVEAVNSTSMNLQQRVNTVTSFRLVMDTLSSQYQPLWTEMEGPIMTTFQQVKTAAENGNSEEYHSTLNSFLTKYNIIQPSLKLDIPVDKAQQLDTRISYIDQYRQDVIQGTNPQETLSNLEKDLQNLFDGVTEDESDPSLWWVIISTGSIIILTLSYVGWRKYKGESEESKKAKRLKD